MVKTRDEGSRGGNLMDDTEISNDEVVHGRGRGQFRHPTGVPCIHCQVLIARPSVLVPKVYKVRFEEHELPGGDGSVMVGVQEVSGAPETVAAFLRALADQLSPPRRVTRSGTGMSVSSRDAPMLGHHVR